MSVHPPFTYWEIDWNLLWKNAREKKSRPGKKIKDWDKDARAFAQRNADSPYTSMVISRLSLNKEMTVLDVGSGPGTLALPLAEHVAAVTAVDYSTRMLEVLSDLAKEKNLGNLATIKGSWEDDWDTMGIGIYDLVIASRSLIVEDLEGALQKIDKHAGKSACIIDRIAPSPFDPAAYAAVGRPFDSGPDYIFVLNALYCMGIHPSVDILELDRDLIFPDREKALETYSWMFNDLSRQELSRLNEYLSSRIIKSDSKHIVLRREYPPRWAMIRWQKTG
jgi:SAM-dependent methyltransferase